jgi:hypothetical protein
MGTISAIQRQSLASKLQRLGERVDAETVDAVLDEILRQIGDLKSVVCALGDDESMLCLQSKGELVADVKLSRAKSILRLMNARLAVRASDWAKREVSPHGDRVEFAVPKSKLLCNSDFENTPDTQRFEINMRV